MYTEDMLSSWSFPVAYDDLINSAELLLCRKNYKKNWYSLTVYDIFLIRLCTNSCDIPNREPS